MLKVNHLGCMREDRLLFSGLSFSAETGECIQISGANGVGKSSLLRILAGLSTPVKGQVLWKEQPIADDRAGFYQQLLFLGHQSGIKAELTAYENLRQFQQLYNAKTGTDLWRILALVGLAGLEEQLAAQLSAGQQRRISLARLWLSKARLWLLDEPFTAIDKQGVTVLESLLLAHCENGGTVIMTSHQDLKLASSRLRTIDLTDWVSSCS